jgi:hypothetical protein
MPVVQPVMVTMLFSHALSAFPVIAGHPRRISPFLTLDQAGETYLWVSIKGGAHDGLWIPYEGFVANSSGAADDIPACDSLWFKIFPFL